MLTLPADPQFTARDADLASGQEVEGDLPLGTFDVYQFEASSGDTILASMGDLTGLNAFITELRLYGPDGSLVSSNTGNLSSELDVTAGATGTYTLVAGDTSSDNSGAYRLRVLTLPADPQLTARDQALSAGDTLVGDLPFGTFDLYRFDAAIGDPIFIAMYDRSGSNGFIAELRLFAPDGTLAADATGNFSAVLTHDAEHAGTYTIVAGDTSSDDDGAYRLGLRIPPGDNDLDGDVDAFDLGLWQVGFGIAENATVNDGDADADGDVDAFDLGLWQTNFGFGQAAAAVSATSTERTATNAETSAASPWLDPRRVAMLAWQQFQSGRGAVSLLEPAEESEPLISL